MSWHCHFPDRKLWNVNIFLEGAWCINTCQTSELHKQEFGVCLCLKYFRNRPWNFLKVYIKEVYTRLAETVVVPWKVREELTLVLMNAEGHNSYKWIAGVDAVKADVQVAGSCRVRCCWDVKRLNIADADIKASCGFVEQRRIDWINYVQNMLNTPFSAQCPMSECYLVVGARWWRSGVMTK